MRFDILTLFPGFFDSPLKQSIMGKAVEKGLLTVKTRDIRDYTTDKHRTADDYPYGGGHGMVMKVEPVARALEAVKAEVNGNGEDNNGVLKEALRAPRVILTSPQGVPLSHSLSRELSKEERLVIICGRYEGVDERVMEFVDLEVSTGDYILTGGEIPALAIIDAVCRFIPGVLGDEASAEYDSFSDGLLEYPQYTRPEEWQGLKVPEVLLSGNHAEIAKWRRSASIRQTCLKRPDLLKNAALAPDEERMGEVLENAIKRPIFKV
ncbi:MAG: tRNA (guanosine(37)-N1)-methyltransferase TrmD [Deltaproteobacteria bacterium]|nr:tRNA (guanosine(37)-N1)-methyltransferase TrmD [Deltaproteobacteria bacterium]